MSICAKYSTKLNMDVSTYADLRTAADGMHCRRRNRKLPSAPMLSSLANGNGALILPLRTREARKSLDGMDASSSVVDDAANGGRSGLPAEVRRGSADNEFDGIMVRRMRARQPGHAPSFKLAY